jgi:hypothetical protein
VKKPAEKKSRPPKMKVKNDPALAAKARELRDRWMEQLKEHPQMMLGDGKYEVGRANSDEVRMMNDEVKAPRALPAAA